MGWTSSVPDLAALEPESLARLNDLIPMDVPRGTVLFQPGDSVKGYVIALSGRIGVHLIGETGRELLLYDVTPGSSCIQSTLGLLGTDDYSAEAVAEEPSRVVLLPRALFLDLLDHDGGFRGLVFGAFAQRMQATMHMLERVAFQSVDARLASHLLSRADQTGRVTATHQEIAAAIGSAREVVSRRLEAMRKRGWLEHGRGYVDLTDRAALRQIDSST
jgi:CRP/FNR family transcriptional regulator